MSLVTDSSLDCQCTTHLSSSVYFPRVFFWLPLDQMADGLIFRKKLLLLGSVVHKGQPCLVCRIMHFFFTSREVADVSIPGLESINFASNFDHMLSCHGGHYSI